MMMMMMSDDKIRKLNLAKKVKILEHIVAEIIKACLYFKIIIRYYFSRPYYPSSDDTFIDLFKIDIGDKI
jgi:hypothetical protein